MKRLGASLSLAGRLVLVLVFRAAYGPGRVAQTEVAVGEPSNEQAAELAWARAGAESVPEQEPPVEDGFRDPVVADGYLSGLLDAAAQLADGIIAARRRAEGLTVGDGGGPGAESPSGARSSVKRLRRMAPRRHPAGRRRHRANS